MSGVPPSLDSEIRRSILDRIMAFFPDCPRALADRFIGSLDSPAEDLARACQLLLEKPYGRNHILVADGPAGLSFAVLRPGQSSSLHYHTVRRELFCVRRGTLLLTSGDCTTIMRPFECGESVPGVSHAIANAGEGPLEIIEMFAPALLNDKVRVRDPYRRKLGGVGVRE